MSEDFDTDDTEMDIEMIYAEMLIPEHDAYLTDWLLHSAARNAGQYVDKYDFLEHASFCWNQVNDELDELDEEPEEDGDE
jgi:hypothetical protein